MQLHWQILIALILAIIYGIVFSTTYSLNKADIESLSKNEIATEQLVILVDIEFKSLSSFNQALDEQVRQLNEYEKAVITEKAYKNKAVNAIGWLGDVFLRALKMLIIPLILSSLISGITSIGSGGSLGRLGLKTIAYYISTSLFAILTGLFLVNLFKPGVGADLNFSHKVEGLVEKQRTFQELLIDIIPDNIFRSLMEADMLSIIFFAVLFGFFITKVNKQAADTLSNFFQALFDVMMKLTMFVIKFTPIGIFGIVAKVVADQDDLGSLLVRMGMYMGTVVLALAIHFFITLPIATKYIGKVNPFKHLKNMSTPLLTAFSTSSSGATLPLTIDAVENKSGVSNKVSSFTLPLGATINMDGTALYECVAAIFIAQAYGVDLSFGAQIIIVGTALLASIGAAAIPMAGLVMITVILSAVQLPLEGVGLILAVDRILDMFRTATNVWSDSCGAVIIAKTEGEELKV